MAERNVSVKLDANVASYMSAMGKAKAATTGFSSDSQRNLTQLGGAMQSVGRTATLGITAPLVGLGAAAVHMAGQFETSFAQMVGLAGVPQSEIEGLKESVLALAGETATAPQDLAEALYFLRSSGLDSAEAMDALEMSAQASAAGLGDTAVIADAVSSAMNAYAASGLSAAEATDILVATARAGKAEPEELAGALGRVLPIASELGITFEDVGGALAALSLTGNDASTSATLLTNIMNKLLKPSQQGAKALAEVGLSTDSIRQSIADNGLLATLQMLKTKLGDAGFVRFMEDAQAVQGALTLVGDESGTVAEAFDIVKDHAGATGDAFAAVADTDAFKMKQAFVDVQTAMVQLGSILLPIVAEIASSIAGLAKWFSGLSPAVQTVIAVFGGLAAAAGPVLMIAGSIVKNWTALSKAFEGSSGKIGAASKALGLVGLAATAAFIGYQAFTADQRKTDTVTRNVSEALLGNMAALYATADAATSAADEIDAVALAQDALSLALGEGYEGLADKFAALNISGTDLFTILAQMDQAPATAMGNLARSFGFTAEQADALANSNIFAGGFGGSVEALATQIGAPVEQVEAFRTAFIELQGAMDNVDLDAIAEQFLNSQVAAEGYSGSLVQAAEDQAGHSRQTGSALEVLYAWTQQLVDADDETRDAVLGSEEYQAALAALPPELQALMGGAGDATGAVDGLATAMRAASDIDLSTHLQEQTELLDRIFSERTSAINDAIAPGRAWVRTHYDMAAAFRDFDDAITTGDGEIDLMTQGIDASTEAGQSNAETILDMADNIIAMTNANVEAGKTQQETNAEYTAAREGLLAAAEAAGLNRDDVEDLINTYGLVPDLVTTQIAIADLAIQQYLLGLYLDKLDEIPEEVATQIEAAMDEGDIARAQAILQAWINQPRTIYIGISGPGASYGSRPGRPRDSHSNTPTAIGGYFASAVYDRSLAESGPEVVLPLRDPNRMAALLGMPQVGPYVAAAMSNLRPMTSLAPASVMPAAGRSVGLHVENLNVTDRRDIPQVTDVLGKTLFLAEHSSG